MSNPAEIAQASLQQHYAYHGDVYIGAGVPMVIDEHVTTTPYLIVAIGTLPDAREQWSVPEEGTPEVVIIEAKDSADKAISSAQTTRVMMESPMTR